MTQQVAMSARAWAELLLLAGIWGATFFFTEIALRGEGALTVVAFRVGLGAMALWLILARTGIPAPAGAPIWAALAIMGLLNNLVPFSLITWGQQFIDSGLASILNASTAVIAVPVAALFFADERMTLNRVIGVLVSFAGVAVVVGWSSLGGLDPASLGQVAVLGAALSYALAGVWGRKRLKGLHPLASATGMVTCSALILAPVAIATEGWPSLAYSRAVWTALAYQGVVATAVAYLLYYRVLQMAGIANLALVTLLLPPFAILLGWLFLGEALSGSELGGFALIALGLLILDGRLLRRVCNGRAAGT